MKRVVSVWLPLLATERLVRIGGGPPAEAPFATTGGLAANRSNGAERAGGLAANRSNGAERAGGLAANRSNGAERAGSGNVRRLLAVDGAARRAGLKPGMSLADALALAPGLALAPADLAADRALLDRLAEWCGHYTPWAAADGWSEGSDGGGLWLDVSGCAHLFGGEDGLLAHLGGRLRRSGFTVRAALADTPGAAWAWARFGDPSRPCLPPGCQRASLAPLPVAALRLRPATAATLAGLGLGRIGDLYALPRAGLAARFGREVAHRLDQALGHEAEPITPRRPPASHAVHASFAEPIARPEDVAEATRRLLARLCVRLEKDGLGLRRLEVAAFRVDASLRRIAVGTSRPARDPGHLFRLLAEELGGLDAGFGIEALRLAAAEVAPLAPEQTTLAAPGAGPGLLGDDFARLLDSLGNRLGFDKVARLAPQQSHLPERAVRRQSPHAPLPPQAGSPPQTSLSTTGWPAGRRPLRLFSRPEPVEAVAPVPDLPPVMFRWRRGTHRVVRADGAERIAAEWWRRNSPERDYYLVEDEHGRRFWLFREGLYGGTPPPRWYLHGIFP